jgi:shikimate dehydrogenase
MIALRLALIGDPVAHSRSPDLQRRFLREAGLAGTYEAIRVARGTGQATIDALRAAGYHGLNVTTPLKEEAFARAEWHDATALACGSVNTLVFGDRVEGYNTDGIGTLGALSDAGLADPSGARVLVLGAGPTARAATAALVAADAAVYVWNRSPLRAASIARALDAHLFAGGVRFDAVFAALPPAVTLEDPLVLPAIRDAPLFVDANYGDRATLARSLGRSGSDGLTMLEHSARASFELWHNAHRDIVAEARDDPP